MVAVSCDVVDFYGIVRPFCALIHQASRDSDATLEAIRKANVNIEQYGAFALDVLGRLEKVRIFIL